jgi:hypothetical protein
MPVLVPVVRSLCRTRAIVGERFERQFKRRDESKVNAIGGAMRNMALNRVFSNNGAI